MRGQANFRAKAHAIANGFKSGLEDKVSAQLEAANACAWGYEDFSIPYVRPEKVHKYTPDFWLSNGIVIETKGRFLSEDRQKLKLIKAQYPDLDIRLVFSNSKTPIRKGSPTSYAKWCEDQGFKYADRLVPQGWLEEELNEASMLAMKKLNWRR